MGVEDGVELGVESGGEVVDAVGGDVAGVVEGQGDAAVGVAHAEDDKTGNDVADERRQCGGELKMQVGGEVVEHLLLVGGEGEAVAGEVVLDGGGGPLR